MHLSLGPSGVCFPQHWSSFWAEPELSFCFPAVQLPLVSPCRCWEHQKNRSLLAASPVSRVPQPFSVSHLLYKPRPSCWHAQKEIKWTGTERRGKESNADFVCPSSAVASSWAADHSCKRS